MTIEEIDMLIAKHGSQSAAAASLGITGSALRQRRRRAGGLCVKCGVPVGDRALCPVCAQHQQDLNRRRSARLAEAQRCISCGCAAIAGTTRCADCSALNRAVMARRYQYSRTNSLCAWCNEPTDGKALCDACRGRDTARRNDRHR